MTEMITSNSPKAVENSLLASGFPFQTAVAQVVRQVSRCKLIGEEVPWRDATGNDQFLDLLAQIGSVIFPIECKKTQKEMFTFLQPKPNDGDINRARCAYLTQIQDSTRRMEPRWDDRDLMPRSVESMFCVVGTSDSGRDQRMLERDAQRLIGATDAYVERHKRDFQPQTQQWDILFIPLLVTNAKLFVAEYDPSEVSLETGQFSAVPIVRPVSWVRFRKPFASAGRDEGDRTVFVIAAAKLAEFLSRLDLI